MKPIVLVAGGAGYVGSHVVNQLYDVSWPVVVLDDLSTGRRESIPDDVPFVQGDVGDRQLVGDVLRGHDCWAVLHFAGSIIVSESFENPLAYYLNNVVASQNLISMCVEAGVKAFVFSSSAAVYGESIKSPIPESAETRPISPYGRTKLITEWALADISKVADFRHVCLRYFNVAGADRQGRCGQSGPVTTHIIKTLTEVAVGKRDKFILFGNDYPTPDGTCIRDYIHVDDLARAHVAALDHLIEGGDSLTVNCGYGHGYSNQEIITAMGKVAAMPIAVELAARRLGDVAELVGDPTLIGEALDWSPTFDDLEMILRSALDWERGLTDG